VIHLRARVQAQVVVVDLVAAVAGEREVGIPDPGVAGTLGLRRRSDQKGCDDREGRAK
jgi:hypothetical protein